MATFKSNVKRVREVKNHDNADSLELVILSTGHQICSPVGKFEEGDLVVHIEPDSLVPEWLQEKLGVRGYLAGPDENRVKAIRLRGKLSEGLLYETNWLDDTHASIETSGDKRMLVKVGDDVSGELGIEKYEPPIPTHMGGEVWNARGVPISYDIENIRDYGDLIQDDDVVYVSEKLHGTNFQICVVSDDVVKKRNLESSVIITSKGRGGKGLAVRENEKNVYWKAAQNGGVIEKLTKYRKKLGVDYLYMFGEVYGQGIQNLGYNTSEPTLRAFDMYTGEYRKGVWGSYHDLLKMSDETGISLVPLIYYGYYKDLDLESVTRGNSNICEDQIKEGVVVAVDPPHKRTYPRKLPCDGRVKLKSISEEYLVRKNGTEYN